MSFSTADILAAREESRKAVHARETIEVCNKANNLKWRIDNLEIDQWKRSLYKMGVRFTMTDTTNGQLIYDSDNPAEEEVIAITATKFTIIGEDKK
jgi:hypothetical protein